MKLVVQVIEDDFSEQKSALDQLDKLLSSFDLSSAVLLSEVIDICGGCLTAGSARHFVESSLVTRSP